MPTVTAADIKRLLRAAAASCCLASIQVATNLLTVLLERWSTDTQVDVSTPVVVQKHSHAQYNTVHRKAGPRALAEVVAQQATECLWEDFTRASVGNYSGVSDSKRVRV